jgi:hypothetical protein
MRYLGLILNLGIMVASLTHASEVKKYRTIQYDLMNSFEDHDPEFEAWLRAIKAATPLEKIITAICSSGIIKSIHRLQDVGTVNEMIRTESQLS